MPLPRASCCGLPLLLLPLPPIHRELVTLEVPVRGMMRPPEVPAECPQEIADLIKACMQVGARVHARAAGWAGGRCRVSTMGGPAPTFLLAHGTKPYWQQQGCRGPRPLPRRLPRPLQRDPAARPTARELHDRLVACHSDSEVAGASSGGTAGTEGSSGGSGGGGGDQGSAGSLLSDPSRVRPLCLPACLPACLHLQP